MAVRGKEAEALRHVTGWVADLVSATAHRREPPDDQTIALFASMLFAQLPVEAFTLDGLIAVTDGQPFFPSAPEIAMRLRVWWKERAPPPATPLLQANIIGIPADQRPWLDYWCRELPARQAEERDILAWPPERPRPALMPVARLESLIRRFAPAVWDHLERDRPREAPADRAAHAARIVRNLRAPLVARSAPGLAKVLPGASELKRPVDAKVALPAPTDARARIRTPAPNLPRVNAANRDTIR